jgi:hypothetical protein
MPDMCPVILEQFTEVGKNKPITLPCNHVISVEGAIKVCSRCLSRALLALQSGFRGAGLTPELLPQVLQSSKRLCPRCGNQIPDHIGIEDLPVSGAGFNAMHRQRHPDAKFDYHFDVTAGQDIFEGRVCFWSAMHPLPSQLNAEGTPCVHASSGGKVS